MTQTLKDIKMLKGATLGVEFLDILSMNSEQLSRSNSRKPSRAVSQTGFSTLLSPSDSTAPSRLSIKRTLTNIEVYNTGCPLLELSLITPKLMNEIVSKLKYNLVLSSSMVPPIFKKIQRTLDTKIFDCLKVKKNICS